MFPIPLARRTNRAVLDRSNLIINGDMETGNPPSIWFAGADAPAMSSVADARTGSLGTKSMDIAVSAAQTTATIGYALTGMEVGKSYRLSWWAKNIDGDHFFVGVYNSAFSVVMFAIDNLNPGNKWSYYSHEFTSTDTSGYILLITTGTVGQHARYDDFRLSWISTAGIGIDLITLGNMESGDPPYGWLASGGTPTLAAAADERTGGLGSQSLDILVAAAQTQGAAQNSFTVSTTIGATYQATIWLKNVDLTTGIRLVVFDAAYNILATGETQSGTSWLESQFTFVAATTTTIMYPQALGTAGQHGRVDDISVRHIW